jgi:murein DD-endopeptidase MepM/ murein hydrolase activator NlpD
MAHRAGRAVSPPAPPQRRKSAQTRILWSTLAAVLIAAPGAEGAAGTALAASDYPSWSDVESARASEAAKQAQISELKQLIETLTMEALATQALATQRATEYELAQATFDEATYRAGQLQEQAVIAAARADQSGRQAGISAAMLARTGGQDLTMMLFLDPASADTFLSRLGAISKFTERVTRISAQAVNDRNAATAVTDQAQLASRILGDLAREAEAALTAAIDAHTAAEAALAAQNEKQATLQAQLAVLTENRAATEEDFAKGEAARRAAEAAAAAARAGGNAGLDLGQLSRQGWALPVSGWISDRFGPRPNRPVAGVGAFHYGTDIAASCGQGVYAATAGTVVYADWLGSYGRWVLIDHGGGVQTGYAHNYALYVEAGQSVAAGANIASVGSTGASTGCHLHYEVRVGGARIDPQPFMSARGVTLG